WWSVISLAHQLRTVELAVAKLTEWFDTISWAITTLYAIWGGVRDALLAITRPLYDLLPWHWPAASRDGATFGFFLGLRMLSTFDAFTDVILDRLWTSGRIASRGLYFFASLIAGIFMGLAVAVLFALICMDRFQELNPITALTRSAAGSSPSFGGVM